MRKHNLWPQFATIALTISVLLASFGRPAMATNCNTSTFNITAPCTIATAGHWRVTTDYQAGSGVDGFDIGVNNVTVDISGHSITGVTTATGMGVGGGTTYKDTYLISGTFANFGGGAVCTGSGSYIAYVNATMDNAANTAGAIAIYPTDGIVTGTTAVNNSFSGIRCDNDCIIEKSVASQNVYWGFIAGVNGGLVRDNVATGNGNAGLLAQTTTAFGENAFSGNTSSPSSTNQVTSGVTTNDNVCQGVSC